MNTNICTKRSKRAEQEQVSCGGTKGTKRRRENMAIPLTADKHPRVTENNDVTLQQEYESWNFWRLPLPPLSETDMDEEGLL